ncbi:hypothetical protein GmRootV213_49590 (plasmid) [Variovorax sp. V213]
MTETGRRTNMIYELADFQVKAEDHTAFGEALARAIDAVLSKAQGYRTHQVLACRETPGRCVLMVGWDSVEDHMVGFRQSAAFADWRAIIGPFFAKLPHVEHFELFASSAR